MLETTVSSREFKFRETLPEALADPVVLLLYKSFAVAEVPLAFVSFQLNPFACPVAKWSLINQWDPGLVDAVC